MDVFDIVDELLGIIKDAGVLGFKRVDHLRDDVLRRENLVRLLRRDVVEDVLGLALVEVICQLRPLSQKLPDGVVEYTLVKQRRPRAA